LTVSAKNRAASGSVWAVSGDDGERSAVDVDRMNEAAVRPDHPHLQRFTDLHHYGVGRRKRLAVEREEVRLPAVHRHRRICQPFTLEPFLNLQRVFVIRGERWIGRGRVDDERAVEAERLLPAM